MICKITEFIIKRSQLAEHKQLETKLHKYLYNMSRSRVTLTCCFAYKIRSSERSTDGDGSQGQWVATTLGSVLIYHEKDELNLPLCEYNHQCQSVRVSRS